MLKKALLTIMAVATLFACVPPPTPKLPLVVPQVNVVPAPCRGGWSVHINYGGAYTLEETLEPIPGLVFTAINTNAVFVVVGGSNLIIRTNNRPFRIVWGRDGTGGPWYPSSPWLEDMGTCV